MLLSFLLLTLRPATPLRRHLITHLDTVLFLGWCLYAYRDLLPLFTYHLIPTDLDNAVTWTRIGLLSVVAVLVPLVRPRTYVPADPANPTPVDQIHPEQTASWLSLMFFEFMTGLVWKAWKSPSLPYDELHPMADYDKADHLYKHNVANLDPVKRQQRGLKKRHLLGLLAWNYRFEAFMTCEFSLCERCKAHVSGNVRDMCRFRAVRIRCHQPAPRVRRSPIARCTR